MKAAWYDSQGPAAVVLRVGSLPDPTPGAGEVRVRIHASGINPGEVKKRSDAFGIGMPYPRVIPHSDGAGVVDLLGDGVEGVRVGDRVWCFGAQSYRPFGTAAEYVVVPAQQVAPLPPGVEFAQGACLGIPGITGHQAVHAAGPVEGRTILVQGGAGAVGSAAVAMGTYAGARVVATVRSEAQAQVALNAGAKAVVRTDGIGEQAAIQAIEEVCPDGVDHVVEVAFNANIRIDERVLNQGGSIATYATFDRQPSIPFWLLVFKNIHISFLGSDDFTPTRKAQAAADLSDALKASWSGYTIGERLPLEKVAQAHEAVEAGARNGRVVLEIP